MGDTVEDSVVNVLREVFFYSRSSPGTYAYRMLMFLIPAQPPGPCLVYITPALCGDCLVFPEVVLTSSKALK